jgi:hypothetical protein
MLYPTVCTDKFVGVKTHMLKALESDLQPRVLNEIFPILIYKGQIVEHSDRPLAYLFRIGIYKWIVNILATDHILHQASQVEELRGVL